MKIGDKVKVNARLYNLERRAYPFYPDLAGESGVISKIQTTTDSGSDLDEPIYWVKFEKIIQVGVIPESESAYNFQPTEFREVPEWSFLAEVLQHVSKNGR